MKASEHCKQAGLKSLKQLSDLTHTSPQTLINWHKNKPELFAVVVAGAVVISNPKPLNVTDAYGREYFAIENDAKINVS